MRNLTLFVLLCVGILSVAELTVIVSSVPPSEASRQELYSFFVALAIALGSWGSLVWHGIKSRILYRFNKPSLLGSVRQALIASTVITLCLFFNSLGILSLWDIVPLVLAAVLIEFFFQAEKTSPVQRSS